jgi:uncharacterized protein
MFVLQALAYFLIGMTGISFGLIGAGGAILMVPIMVYMLGISSEKATGYALPISVLVSGVGALMSWKQKQLQFRKALEFGFPTAITSFATRKFILPLFPEIIAGIPRKNALMFAFAMILLTAAFAMIKAQKFQTPEKPHPWTGILLGIGVGLISGIFGVGGGFMIVPILVLFFGIPMREAVGTSLCAVVMITSFGFAAEVLNNPQLPWSFLAGVMVAAATGMVIGTLLRQKVDGNRLKLGFGYFVFSVGLLVIGLELYKLRS